jgi:TatD DNase family protein
MKPYLIDSHCHLNNLPVPQLLKENKENGISFMVSNASNFEEFQQSIDLHQKFPEIAVCLGIHPKQIFNYSRAQIEKALQFIEASKKSIAGIGETGLDFSVIDIQEKKEFQSEIFRKHIQLAKKLRKPIVVHSRNARKEVLKEILNSEIEKALFHWFRGSKSQMHSIIENNFFVSVSPVILFDSSFDSFVKRIPLENLLLETDAPVPYNGSPAHPFWVKKIAERIAEIKQIPFQKIADATTQNAVKLFDLK